MNKLGERRRVFHQKIKILICIKIEENRDLNHKTSKEEVGADWKDQ